MGAYIDRVDGKVTMATVGRLTRVGPITVPIPSSGINSAYTALNSFGNQFAVAVPQYGAIVSALFLDQAEQGLAKELWISSEEFAFVADHSAFQLTQGADLLSFQGVITFGVYKDGVNCEIGLTADLPLWYTAPNGVLFMQFKTLGTDTVSTAAKTPQVVFGIESYAGPMPPGAN